VSSDPRTDGITICGGQIQARNSGARPISFRAAQDQVHHADLSPQHRQRRTHLPGHPEHAPERWNLPGSCHSRIPALLRLTLASTDSPEHRNAAGSWKPAVNLSTVLASVQQLIADPNPDDGLVPEITQEFKENRALYESTARSHTAKHAVDAQNATIRGHQETAAARATSAEKEGGVKAVESLPAREQGAGAEASEESEDEEEDLQSLWGETR